MVRNHLLSQSIRALILTLLVSFVCRPAEAATSFSGSTSASPTSAGASPVIGVNDIGRMSITAPSAVSSVNSNIGDLPGGIGLVTVTDFAAGTGSAAVWNTNTLIVGDEGTGRLDVLNGAVTSVDFTASPSPGVGDVLIGNFATSVGTVVVNGLGTLLKMGDDTFVGVNGTGTLRIENEGFVNATNDLFAAGDTDAFTIGILGRVEFAANGRLRTHAFINNGVIVGKGRVDSVNAISNSTTGHIAAETGDRLVVNALLTTQGEIAANGGQIELFKAVTSSHAGAEVTLRNGGRVSFPVTGFGYDSTAGTLSSVAGVNDVYGTVRLQGANSKIVVAGESTVVFHDAVTNSGGAINVFPGSTAVYLGGLTTTGSGAVLSIHLADPEAEPDLGQVEVNGVAQLAGNLAISLESGFVPSAGDSFQILSASSVTGTLGLGSAPPLPGGLIWDIDVNATNVLLSVISSGDYNANGVVDAGDYALWRKTLGATGAGLAADGDGSGEVDQADYFYWLARFGNVIGAPAAGAIAAGAVPEPSGAALILIGFAAALIGKRQAANGDATIRKEHLSSPNLSGSRCPKFSAYS